MPLAHTGFSSKTDTVLIKTHYNLHFLFISVKFGPSLKDNNTDRQRLRTKWVTGDPRKWKHQADGKKIT
jgi:hypothetical protein